MAVFRRYDIGLPGQVRLLRDLLRIIQRRSRRTGLDLVRGGLSDMAAEGLAELGDGEGLVQHPVHPGLLPAERLGAHHMRGQGDDAFGRAPLARLVLADTAGCLVAVHLRHGNVHQDQIIVRHMCLAQGLEAVAGEIGG